MSLDSWLKKRTEFKELKKRIKEGNYPSIEELKQFVDKEMYDFVTYSIKKGFYDGGNLAYKKEEIIELFNYASTACPKGFWKRLNYENMILLLKPPYPTDISAHLA